MFIAVKLSIIALLTVSSIACNLLTLRSMISTVFALMHSDFADNVISITEISAFVISAEVIFAMLFDILSALILDAEIDGDVISAAVNVAVTVA